MNNFRQRVLSVGAMSIKGARKVNFIYLCIYLQGYNEQQLRPVSKVLSLLLPYPTLQRHKAERTIPVRKLAPHNRYRFPLLEEKLVLVTTVTELVVVLFACNGCCVRGGTGYRGIGC